MIGTAYWVAQGIDESVLQGFGHIERMENDGIAKRVYVGEGMSSRLVGRLRKGGLNVGQERRMVRA